MDTKELIHKLEKARTKDDLEKLGIDHLGIDVDKREAKEVLRAKLITAAEARQEPAPEPASEPAEVAQTREPASDPEPREPEQAEVNRPAGKNKMGRNKRTGRQMVWTAAMAKMPHMEEV